MNNKYSENCNKLLEYTKDIKNLDYVAALLDWDMQTGMPEKGSDGRAAIIETVGKEIHIKSSSNKLMDLAQTVLNNPVSDEEKNIAKYWLEIYKSSVAVPEKLIGELVNVETKSYDIWTSAESFSETSEILKRMVDLKFEYASCFSDQFNNTYDCLLSDYEPDITQYYLNNKFSEFAIALPELREKSKSIIGKLSRSNRQYVSNGINDLSYFVCEKIGFDLTRGKIGLAQHPFQTNIGPDDYRITSYKKNDNIIRHLGTLIHEAGHAIYEQNSEYKGTGLDNLHSMGIHESQSLFYEIMLGSSPDFWEPFRKEIRKNELLPVEVSERSRFTNEEIANDIKYFDFENTVRLKSGIIDYGLHILIRYDLERALFNKEIIVDDMEEYFNSLCKKYLGITPKNPKEGVLQDVHWYCGYFGYFPSYLLGVGFAAQLRQLAPADKTDFPAIKKFLYENVHQYGNVYNFEKLTDKLGGFKPSAYIEFIKETYDL